jgi:glycosyltransferase involved in cell wall biosynthesis
MTTVHIVLPNDVDDPAAPSGGNLYDRRICAGLAALGFAVREHAVRGGWPRPSADERSGLAGVLGDIPSGSVVVLDGLIASAVPEVLVPEADRLRLIVLMHMPLGDVREQAALSTVDAVVTTSEWSRRRVLDLYGLSPAQVHVAPPGVDRAPLVSGSDSGSRLLCVAAVVPGKGHDVLIEALTTVGDLPWTCVCAGSLDRDPVFADRVRLSVKGVDFVGACPRSELFARYREADLLVLASRGETYGMVVTEALAHGIPVLATEVQGVPEALGRAPGGSVPGILVPPEDPVALGRALRRWLGEPELRERLRRGARGRRGTLAGWDVTAEQIATVLSGLMTKVSAGR